MKRGQKAFKFFLPLLIILYDMVMMLLVEGLLANISDLYWYYYVIEAFVYIIVIGITYFFIKKLYTKCFPESASYQIGKVSFFVVLGIFLCMFAWYIIEWRILCECFLLNQGTIIPTQDIETIPEILLLSIHAVFIAPVFEELTFRYSLSAYKSTRGKMTAMLLIASLFGLLHISSFYTIVKAGFDGVLYGVGFLKTKKLIVPILMHIGSNACTTLFGILYSMEVGGITLNDSPALMYFNNYWLAAAVLAAIFGFLLLNWRGISKQIGKQ